MSRTVLGLALGLGTLLIGYCIYFDKKRRSDPNFKQKLREKRKSKKSSVKPSNNSTLPDLKDHEAVQRFFLTEVQLGEELLANGELEEGVEHLSNAVAVCGQPTQLLQVLQQTLPPQVFQMLLARLPEVGKKLMGSAGGAPSSGPTLLEDDVE